MAFEDINKTEESLSRLKRTSRIIRTLLKFSFFLFCLLWVVALIILTALLVNPQIVPGADAANGITLLFVGAMGGLIAFILRVAFLVFDDVSKGESPFTKRQVKRIRWVAYALLIYAVIDMLFPTGEAFLMQEGNFHFAYSVTNGPNNPSISINVGALATAIIFYCLSLVFEYGTLLQQLSDETL